MHWYLGCVSFRVVRPPNSQINKTGLDQYYMHIITWSRREQGDAIASRFYYIINYNDFCQL